MILNIMAPGGGLDQRNRRVPDGVTSPICPKRGNCLRLGFSVRPERAGALPNIAEARAHERLDLTSSAKENGTVPMPILFLGT
ncbi:MAG: hypothetical protein ACU84J_09045 [Gammaproteobacteria bacterium]